MIQAGDTLHAHADLPFAIDDHTGGTLTLETLIGSPTVLFFYPKANTPGCTTEAIAFSAHKDAFEALGVRVFGISADSVKKQSNFATKHDLTLPLLADTERSLIEPWGIWAEKKNYGKTYMGIVRTTVFLDAEGTVVQVWSPVKVKGHVEAVLAACTAWKGQ